MPIRPENRDRYPPNWRGISTRIRFERPKGTSEFCRIAETGKPIPKSGSMFVLTPAPLSAPTEA